MTHTYVNNAIVREGSYVGELSVHCPVCGDDYSHIRDVYTRVGTDPHEAGVYPGTRAQGTTDDRRSALAIVFAGECGHDWELCIQQQKGVNIVRCTVADIQRQGEDITCIHHTISTPVSTVT